MIKLTLLTLAGLFAVWTLWGEPGARKPAQVAETPAAQIVAQPEPEPVPDVVEAASQTPERVQSFPGPELQPSPEYAGQTPPAATPVAADGATILYVTGSRVNFRAGPSTNDTVVGAITGGSPVEALGPVDADWVHIRDAQGREGFMSSSFLSASAPG